jgi:hypothetical protein
VQPRNTRDTRASVTGAVSIVARVR